MSTDQLDYYRYLLNGVRTAATVGETFTGEAFVGEMGTRLSEAEEVDSLITGHFEGIGLKQKKIGFDGYDFGDEDGHVVLAVSHFVNSEELATITGTEANRLFERVVGFVEAAVTGGVLDGLEESSIGFQVGEQLREQLSRTFKIRIYLLTNAILSASAKSFPSRELGPLTIEFHPWDIQRVQRVEESALGREEIDIDLLELVPTGIPALRAANTSSSVETYLAVIPGETLAAIYQKYGARVLESNVRSFLSVRANTNKGIRGTLLQQPEMFLSFNNGITATASAIRTNADGNGLRLVGLKDLQIVNGGQTTASIFYAKREEKGLDLSEVFVQMKLIVVSEDFEADLVPKISRYANTQNQISPADFFSNHKFHQRMEEKSRRLLAPAIAGSPYQTKWFYERTRGQYNTEKSRLGSAGARKFEVEYPRAQVITKTDAAKFIVSWEELPHVVSSGAQKNFIQFAKDIEASWTKNDGQFGDLYFKHLVATGILFNGIRLRVMKSDWYKAAPGYLANIVTYTMAKLVASVRQQHAGSKFNLDAIWTSQAVGDELWKCLEPIAMLVRDQLTSDDRPVANVTEWAKREKCWVEIKSAPIALEAAISSFVISGKDTAGAVREDIQDQKILSGIEAQMHVHGLGREYWAALRAFGVQLNALSPRDTSILAIVADQDGRLPSEAQSKVLVAIESRLKAAGFRS